MSTPPASFDRSRLHQLASAVIDGTASDQQQRELTELLRNNAAAQDEYLALVDLHAVLATELVRTPQDAVVRSSPVATARDSAIWSSQRRWVGIATAAALAASVLIGVTWIRWDPSQSASNPDSLAAVDAETFVTVVHGADAVWDSKSIPVGSRLGASTLQLTSGFTRLEFDSGVEVTLKGPAKFELVQEAKLDLNSGVLTANVPPGAEGFTVNTPTAEVIDLGTSFGIDLRDDGTSNVAVFDGEVEVAVRDATEKRLLTEGESIRIGEDYVIEDAGFDIARFEKLWPIASGIVGSTETVRFVPPWPRQIRFVQSDDDIFVATEGPSVELNRDLQVNISKPGDYGRGEELTPIAIPSGQRVRSYILHHSPKTQVGPRRAKRVSGSITFDRPVLGMIVKHDELLASSRRFRRRSAGEGNHRRELNLSDRIDGDRITLSEDRKTVTLDLIAPGRSSDLVRVLIDGQRRTPRSRPRKRF